MKKIDMSRAQYPTDQFPKQPEDPTGGMIVAALAFLAVILVVVGVPVAWGLTWLVTNWPG